jgi:hypothetical protein
VEVFYKSTLRDPQFPATGLLGTFSEEKQKVGHHNPKYFEGVIVGFVGYDA